MSRKLVYLTSFVLVLAMICSAMGQNGTGLRAEYYHFTGSTPPARENAFTNLIVTRIEPGVNCYWNPGIAAPPSPQILPPPGVRTDTFSVRWSGEIEALNSEAYM